MLVQWDAESTELSLMQLSFQFTPSLQSIPVFVSMPLFTQPLTFPSMFSSARAHMEGNVSG